MTGSRPDSLHLPARHPPGCTPVAAARRRPRVSSTTPLWRQTRKAMRLVVLDARHRRAFTAHLRSLDTEDRCGRFWSPVNDAYIERYAQGLVGDGHVLVGAMRGRRIVGLAHAALYADGADGLAAEIGISVDVDARKQGLGRRLMRAAIEAVARRRAGRVHVLFNAANTAMAALARSLGGRIVRDGVDSSVVFEPPAGGDAASRCSLLSRAGVRRLVHRLRRCGRCAPPAAGEADRTARGRGGRPASGPAVASGMRRPTRPTVAARWIM